MRKKMITSILSVSLMLVAASCGSDSDSSSATSATEPPTEATDLAPADTAPTDTTTETSTGPDDSSPVAVADGEPIKVGMLVELSGQFSVYGTETLAGAELFVDELNADGGVDGRPIELVVVDAGSNPEQAVTGFRRLADEGVAAIAGLGLISEAAAVAPLAEELDIPTFSLSAAYQPENPRMFAGGVFVGDLLFETTKWMDETGIETASVITTNDATGDVTVNAFTALSEQFGIELQTVERFNVDAVDITAELTNAVAGDPDIVIGWTVGRPTAILFQNASNLGIGSEYPFVTSYGNLATGFLGSIGDAVPETLYIQSTQDTFWRDADTSTETGARIADFAARYQAKTGNEIGLGSAIGYDALQVLSEAFAMADPSDAAAVVAAIESISDLPGIVGTYTF